MGMLHACFVCLSVLFVCLWPGEDKSATFLWNFLFSLLLCTVFILRHCSTGPYLRPVHCCTCTLYIFKDPPLVLF